MASHAILNNEALVAIQGLEAEIYESMQELNKNEIPLNNLKSLRKVCDKFIRETNTYEVKETEVE